MDDVARFRKRAVDARLATASATDVRTRDSLLLVARGWGDLADEYQERNQGSAANDDPSHKAR